VSEVCLLVELGLLETERVDNVDPGLLLVVTTLLVAALGGSVGTGVEGLTTDGDLGAVGLVSHAVNLLEVVRVGDELVTADNVLRSISQSGVRAQTHSAPPSVARSGVGRIATHVVDKHVGGSFGENTTSVKVLDEVVEDEGWSEGERRQGLLSLERKSGGVYASGAQESKASGERRARLPITRPLNT
jgi:hypothetical protein